MVKIGIYILQSGMQVCCYNTIYVLLDAKGFQRLIKSQGSLPSKKTNVTSGHVPSVYCFGMYWNGTQSPR